MTTVSVQRIDETDPAALFRHYDGQTAPQPCFVELDLEDGVLRADWDAVIGNAVPASVWHRRTLRWAIPILTAAAANELLDELAPLAQTVLDGMVIDFDGSNRIGRAVPGAAGDAAADAEAAIAARCDVASADWMYAVGDLVVEYDAGDWFAPLTPGQLAELGVTAEASDDELARIADAATEEAATAGDAGYQVLHGALDYLRAERDALRDID